MRRGWLLDLAGKVLRDLRGSLWTLLLYDAAIALWSFFLWTPLVSWAVSFMAASEGRLSVNNGEVLSFLLSARGVVFVLLVGVLKVVMLYVKQAGMMLIAWESMAGRRMSVPRAFWCVVQRLPGLTLLGARHIVGHVVLLVPLVILGTAAYRFVFSSMPVYFFLLASATARRVGLAVGVLLAAVTLAAHGAVYLHCVFSLPAVVGDNLSAASALTYTRGLLGGKRWRIGVVVFFCWAAIILLPFGLARGFHWFGGEVFARLPERHWLNMPTVLSLMAGYLAISFLAEFVMVAVSSLTITRLYGSLRGLPPAETLELPSPSPSSLAHPRPTVVFLILAGVVSLSVAAIQEGADYAEVDVRFTADGHPVLVHDKDLFRVAEVARNVADLPYERIAALDVGSWFSPRFRDERIPLLADVVALCRDRIQLNIEIKAGSAPREMAEGVVRILREQGAFHECIVSSASIEVVEHIRALDPNVRTGLILSQSLGKVTALDVDFLSVASRLVTPGLIAAAHAAAKEVHVWTVNKPAQMARLIDLGVDNIITDVPREAKTLLEKRAAMPKEELLFLKVRHWFLL
ncbi:MAG: glycerophosphoryl diester phosphodiesterase membrane domain-containing protein [Phycisphaerae bacterium]|nr:glycerophosphoryl diester phosphodiesterase membrane domain-containing protein [Phycisphaerae bacterium]